MRKDVPLAVEVPSPERDKPAWVKVGVIAAVGFIVGVAWPRLVGVRLGPSAPGEASSAAASASGAGRAPDAPPGTAGAKSNSPMASATAASATTPTGATGSTSAAGALPPKIIVTKGNVVSCKTSDGEKKTGKECGAVAGLDLLVREKVKSIAGCGGVEGQTGKFALTTNADFKSGRFWYEVNKGGATVQNIDAITSCLKNAFHGQAVTNVPHEHPRYTVSYSAVLTAEKEEAPAASKAKNDKTAKAEVPPADKGDEESKPAPAVAGEASVAWEVALVRDAPKVGAVVARLPRGTKVKLGAMKEGWYAVKFGDDFSTDGWVYRGAVGR